jgi:hypothetical protein
LQIHKPPKIWENGRRSSPAVTIVSCSKGIYGGMPMDMFGAPAMALRSTAAISIASGIFLLFDQANASR